jgi:hypothetical protein
MPNWLGHFCFRFFLQQKMEKIMDRRSFLSGMLGLAGGSLLVGVEETKQLPLSEEKLKSPIITDGYGNFIIPGFFTVFIDGKESFRMQIGESITAERSCHIIAYNNFESLPSHNFYLHPGDSFTIDS